jgi:apolipoprotein D and lipocalin family protein
VKYIAMTIITSVFTMVAVSLAASDKSLEVVPELDLGRYAGLWYEIARLPNRFQKVCQGDVTATYELREDGTIKVINACIGKNGELEKAEGVARVSDSSGPASKLEVRFAPAFLSFLPFVWGDYWVIDLASDYSHAVVGSPGRDYLWVLSRTPQMDQKLYNSILEKLRISGYDIDKLVRTPQSGKQTGR